MTFSLNLEKYLRFFVILEIKLQLSVIYYDLYLGGPNELDDRFVKLVQNWFSVRKKSDYKIIGSFGLLYPNYNV